MSTTVTYKGSTLTTVENETRTLTTSGKYLEDNITLVDETAPFEPELQTKSETYTPTTSQQTESITADVGYDALERVNITVNAVATAEYSVDIGNNDEFYNDGANRKYRLRPYLFVDGAGWVSSDTAGAWKNYSAVPSGTTITPSTSAQTVGGTKHMMEGAVTVNAIPSEYIIPSGTSNITSNGIYDVANFASASVSVPVGVFPSGTSSITSNGIYDITSFASVDVNVSGGGGISADDIALKTLSGVVSGSAASIAQSAFTNYKYLNGAVFQSATSVGASAFYGCNLLSTASFPNAITLSTNAFGMCYSLNTTDFGKVETIGAQAFQNCSLLTTASFPNATSMGASAFLTCSSLTTAYFPKLSSIPMYAFASCKSLITTNFEMAQTISTQAFVSCSSLATASFPKVTTIGNSAFSRCRMLLSLYLLGSSVPTLANVTVFSSTPISGYTTHTGGTYGSIYVPASLYNTYITATNWQSYSARIVSV